MLRRWRSSGMKPFGFPILLLTVFTNSRAGRVATPARSYVGITYPSFLPTGLDTRSSAWPSSMPAHLTPTDLFAPNDARTFIYSSSAARPSVLPLCCSPCSYPARGLGVGGRCCGFRLSGFTDQRVRLSPYIYPHFLHRPIRPALRRGILGFRCAHQPAHSPTSKRAGDDPAASLEVGTYILA